MKSIMIAVAIMCLAFSAGCAGTQTQFPGLKTWDQLQAQRHIWDQEAKVAEENARIAEEKQAIAWAKENAANQIARDKAEKRRVIEAKKQAIADRELVIAEKKAGDAFNAAVRKAEAKTKAAWNALTPAQQKAAQVNTKCAAQMLEFRVPLSAMSDWMRLCKINATTMDHVEYLQGKVQ